MLRIRDPGPGSRRVDSPRTLKRVLADVLRHPVVNTLLRVTLRPVSRLLPTRLVDRLPVVGGVNVRLEDGRSIRLESDGRDWLAAAFYWRGSEANEPETLDLFVRLLPSSRVVLDIGANVGLFTLAAAVGAPERRVIALEPIPEVVERLRHNLAVNGVGGVEVIAAAAGERDGEIEIHLPPGLALPLSASTLPGFRKGTRSIIVPEVRLDTLAVRLAGARVDLIKIDTEGTEPEALASGREMLARDRPWIICEVLHGLTEERLHAVIDPLGYRAFHITRRGLVRRQHIVGDPRYVERNYLFATDDRLAQLPPGRIPILDDSA